MPNGGPGPDSPAFHLAQANVALTRAPFSDPLMAGLVGRVGEMNALAEGSPGYVRRFVPPAGDLSYLRPFERDFVPYEPERIFFNLSVWETVEALKEYVYRTAHIEMLRDKARWVAPSDGPHLVLWWVPAGQLPAVGEARDRLRRLRRDGPGPEAFTFARPFPPPPAENRPAPPGVMETRDR